MIIPACTKSHDRIYLNWLGIGIAIDASTGKLLWRSESFNTVLSKMQQMVLSGFDSGESSIAVSADGEKLLLVNGLPYQRLVTVPAAAMGVAIPAQRGVVRPATFRTSLRPGSGVIACRASVDGHQLWSNETVSALELSNVLGRPLIVGDVAYILTMPLATPMGGGSDLSLLALSLADGEVCWTLPLGSFAAGTAYRYLLVNPKPLMLLKGDTLYVLSGNGALLSVNLPGRKVDWAFTFEPPPPSMARSMTAYGSTPELRQFGPSLLLSGSTLLFKEGGSNMMFAVDVSAPTLKWQRRIDSDTSIVGADPSAVYLLGDQLNAIDLNSRNMLWSIPTPLGSRQFQPWLNGPRLLLFGAPGIYDIDTQRRTREFFDAVEGGGGAILTLPQRLICISNRTVTAYVTAGQH